MTECVEQFAGGVTLYSGDCLAVLPTLAENSIDACVTDPPYGINFMGKGWDKFKGDNRSWADLSGTIGVDHKTTNKRSGSMHAGSYDLSLRAMNGFQDWCTLWAREVYRVLKPGSHLLAFGGTRTYHRMARAIEDAGFEIRDTISWNFGQGFPKSHDVSNRIERCNCGDGEWSLSETLSQHDLRSVRHNNVPPSEHLSEKHREVLLDSLPEQRLPDVRAESTQESFRAKKSSVEGRSYISKSPRQLREREICSLPEEISDDGAEGRLCDGASSNNGDVGAASFDTSGVRPPSRPPAIEQCEKQFGTVALQPNAQERGAWPHCGRCGKPIIPDGLGTALKPAMELVCLARKPLSEKTVAANVLRWGTGAINVDGCRIGINGGGGNGLGSHFDRLGDTNPLVKFADDKTDSIGRWPANLIHDGSEEVLAGFPDAPGQGGSVSGGDPSSLINNVYGERQRKPSKNPRSDTGSAARFFYTAKADSDDRLGSKHPTVKPLDLMQYLVRLVTPPKGLCLDLFAGTGTTGEAAWREGMRALLIEREPEYQADIRRRMALLLSGPGERGREAIKARMKDKPMDAGPLFSGVNP